MYSLRKLHTSTHIYTYTYTYKHLDTCTHLTIHKKDKFICNMCFKLLQNQDRINPRIHIISTENQQYRVFTNFHRSFADCVFRYQNIKDKFGGISQEVKDNHLNACE